MTVPAANRVVTRQRRRRNLTNAAAAVVLAVGGYVTMWLTERGDDVVNRRLVGATVGLVVLLVLVDELRPIDASSGRRTRRVGGRLDRLARTAPPAPPSRPLGLTQAESSVELALRSDAGRDRGFRASARAVVDSCVPAAPGAPPLGPWLESFVAPETWALIRPDRAAEVARGPGLSSAELARILDDLERL